MTPRVVLTIAGSDSGGGAGIQADLKTFAALGAYGVSVVTAITAQNTVGVTGIHPVPAAMVARQLDAVLEDFEVAAVKVGMIGDPAVAAVVAARAHELPNLVIDPVLVATSGDRLGDVAFVGGLVAYGKVVTPNRSEAAALTGGFVESVTEMEAAARLIGEQGARAVVVTGSEMATDVLWAAGEITRLPGETVSTKNSHGSGCTFSSAIAVRLAAGDDVVDAVRAAKKYVTSGLRAGSNWRLGSGRGPLNHFV